MNDNKLIPLMYPIIIKINESRVQLKKIVFIKLYLFFLIK